MKVDLQINAATTPWSVYRDCSLRAEELGFGALWVYDHLAGSTLRGHSMLESVAVLGGLSTATSHIGLGTMVLNAGLRHPAVLAASLATLQTISNGRLLVGLGAGAAPHARWAAELDAVGIPIGATLTARHRRVIDTIECCNRMWSGELAVSGFPSARPRPPILVGVNSVALTDVAGDHADGINVLISHPRAGEFIDAARRHGGWQPMITITVWAPVGDHKATRTAFGEAVRFDPERIVLAMTGATSISAVERLAELVDA